MRKAHIHFFIFLICWFLLNSYQKNWSRNQIQSDVVGYYGYLTAYFICDDLALKFLDDPNTACTNEYFATRSENGGYVMKMSIGMSLLYLPFFLLGHFVLAPLTGFMADGYSPAYQIALAVGSFFYLTLGFFYLRKILLLYVKPTIVWLVLWSLYLGTNLLWYSYGEALFSHQYSFSLVCILLWVTHLFHIKPSVKIALVIGMLIGLIILVRPINILICSLPFVWNVFSINSLRTKLNFIKDNLAKFSLVLLTSFLVVSIQLIYWHYVTGHFLFYSYVGEFFYFLQPHILEGLIGFRKGWLIYTPLMLFALWGLKYISSQVKQIFLFVVFVFPVFLYVTFSWWCWWYGGSYGMRPLIDVYPILAIPMAVTFQDCMYSSRRSKFIFSCVLVFIIVVNMFQTWQYNVGVLHWDANTKNSYFSVLGSTKKSYEYKSKLRPTDPVRSKKGLPEEYTKAEILAGPPFYIRSSNTFFVSKRNERLFATKFFPDDSCLFKFVPINGDTIKWMWSTNLGVSDEFVGQSYEFIFLEDNSFALKSLSGKGFVSFDVDSQTLVYKPIQLITSKEVFRVYEVK
ncbi:MAG: hypothetical protein J0M08_12940 [Bacteroidetes bacterium]|nr:hypothetical protein [Bacteroidota bacterium]